MPARQACAWDATAKSPVTLVFFIALLLVILVSMSVFRSPAVVADVEPVGVADAVERLPVVGLRAE